MKRKLRRSIYCIVCVLILLSVSCIAAFADVPMYSAGAAQPNTTFVTGPSISVNHSCYVSRLSDYFKINYSLQACLPATNNAYMSGYSDYSNAYFYSSDFDEAEFIFSADYTNFTYDDLTVDNNGFVSGSVHSDFYSDAGIAYLTDWAGNVSFVVRDFYCWPGEFDADTGFYGTSEVEFAFDVSNDNRLSFMESVIYYSVNGSNEVLEYRFDSDDAPSAYNSLNFGVNPSFLPGVSPNDVVYIYEWVISVFDIEAAHYDSGPYFFGILTYNFNPNARKIDVSYGRNFDSDNPAVPLLDYTAWIGTAVSGFLDLQFFPNFTLGGVLMTLLAFTCVIWFLKLVAGG